MAYGHMTLFFDTAADAERYLASCRSIGNFTAENYQDRVSAQRRIRLDQGWAPVPLPPPTGSKARANAPTTRRATPTKSGAR